MKIISKEFITENKNFIFDEIKEGKIFIYPTDTLLGIGCDASNSQSVKKIFEIKKREQKPFLVIAPSLIWFDQNCEYHKENFSKFNLPGPYSFIVNLKNSVVSDLTISKENKIGIRFPNCFFRELIEEIGIPFISTSVNLSGEPSALKIEDIKKEILENVDYVVETSEKLLGKSSEIYDISTEKLIRLR